MTNTYIPIFRSEDEYNRYQEDMIEKVVKRVIDGFSPKENKYLTRQQVADMLNIKFPTLHAWINEGKLIARKIGGRTLFLEDEVKQAIEKKKFINLNVKGDKMIVNNNQYQGQLNCPDTINQKKVIVYTTPEIDLRDDERFCRIADKYYERSISPEGEEILQLRDKQELKQDGVPVYLLPKYTNFTVEHNFFDFRSNVVGYYNLSTPLPWNSKEGKFPTIQQFFGHIFGEQVELGFDYFQLLICNPHQKLPTLALVSKEQMTGKTTWLNFNKMVFGGNCVVMNLSQYAQQFNALYASKLIIGIDETAINESFIKERLKMDSTADTIMLRKMHQEHKPMPFYGKFVLCSNEETNFANIDEDDVRFWVRKLNPIAFDASFSDKLRAEIPAFLHWIINREMCIKEPLSRQWFSKEQLRTEALDAVVEESKSKLYKDICILIDEQTAKHQNGVYVTISELVLLLNQRYSRSDIKQCLIDDFGLPEKPKQIWCQTVLALDKGNNRAYHFKYEPDKPNIA